VDGLKEYTVTTPNLELTDSVYEDLTTDKTTPETIPNRPVEVANERPNSPRNTVYLLTDEEAANLKNDPRVEDVQDLSIFRPRKTAFQTATFSKSPLATGDFVNWGLLRHTSTSNVYGTATADPGGSYDYVLDGTGVDVVIIDSGIQANHPEFRTVDNQFSRVKEIDWFAQSGVSGVMPLNFYTDFDGHGTHVASTMAGKTYGWAKNADIYSIKLQGLQGGIDEGLDVSTAFDVLIGWHNNKVSGRPTILVNSWGYGVFWRTDLESFSFDLQEGTTLYAINGGNYRGSSWIGTTKDPAKGHIGSLVATDAYQFPIRVTSVDADVATAAAAGIFVVNAAGNDSQKIDVDGGLDYNNYLLTDFGTFYYHRGMSPYIASNVGLTIGAVSTSTRPNATEVRASYSNTGPGVDMYAAGDEIMAAMSNNNVYSENSPYFYNSSFKQASLSGTSMAAPQLAGMAALVAQAHPTWGPAQISKYLKTSSNLSLYETGQNNDYSSTLSVHGGSPSLAFFPMADQRPFSIFANQ
jgi:subtilisin family serine protease